MRHFLTLKDFTRDEILEMIELGLSIKEEVKEGLFTHHLKHQILAMIFEKSSTRTRVSFEAGIYQLGGTGLFLSSKDIQLGRGEPMKDTARVLGRMVDMVMIRTFEHASIEEFAKYSDVPVINGLTDSFHPVQLMADYMTMIERDVAENAVVGYVGDGNNMAHSWLIMAAIMGMELRIATPEGYGPDPAIVQEALQIAKKSGASITLGDDPVKAVEGANVVTTDTWVSMGKEEEKDGRISDFSGFIVDDQLMKYADSNAIFLHCLPAYRDFEVSESVLEGPRSAVFDEAENRLHAQKGIMVWLDRHR